ncbi:tetratricopeptide repeat protein [Pseudomonas sp. DCB_BI]|uniref:tetratricopeptide repeat protein n=1 Tax=Pseudomonas sp. DCB_BI TaxID=2993594 RepID=UPI00224B9EF3|nr:tetratricopeptide repeat protein [Pseudomonas sp. DCB_BI]MCX2887326.1 tetratricopeptide repeat protein [Pseudomonas sp. DCB_BI]
MALFLLYTRISQNTDTRPGSRKPMQSEYAAVKRIGKELQLAEKKQDFTAQIRLYQQLLHITPNLAEGHAQLAHLYFEQGNEADAAPHVKQALQQAPSEGVDKTLFPHLYESAQFKADVALARRWYEAHRTLRRFKLLYQALESSARTSELELLLVDALERFTHPKEQSQTLTLLGQLYYGQAKFHDAVGCYQLGLEMTPDNTTQLLNLAVTLEQLGRYAESLPYYKRLLALEPEHASAHNNIAINLLKLGEFEAGWEYYEWRWPAVQPEHYHEFAIPRWTGEPLNGKTLLAWAEQGIGDHIMFASMLSELHQVAEHLHYEIYARLDTLFKRSFPHINFVRREQQGEQDLAGKKIFQQSWPKSDYQIPIGSLPSIFRKSLDSFPRQQSYLKADPQETQMLRDDYRKLFPGKRLIGVSWRGGKTLFTEMQSRLIAFKHLAQLAACTDVQLIDLQYDTCASEREEAARHGVPLHHDPRIDARLDMDKQASQISALDAVVSIDNTTVHLAGALGVRTFVLLPTNPSWRWGIKPGRSYWYPSVEMIRNRELLDWEAAIAEVVRMLKAEHIIA